MKTNLPLLTAIACCSPSYHIGVDGGLLGHVPGDLPQFKKLTEGCVLVLGWNTFKSLPGSKALPGRTHVVYCKIDRLSVEDRLIVDRAKKDGVLFSDAMSQALAMGLIISRSGRVPCMLIGGGAMYRYGLSSGYVDKVVLTVANKSLKDRTGDVSFPIDLLTDEKWDVHTTPLNPLEHNLTPESEADVDIDIVRTYVLKR